MQEDGIGKEGSMEETPPPVPGESRAKQGGEVRARWAWTEPAVWTDRMLTALERGVKGDVWFSLMDKVYAPQNLASAYRKVASNKGSAGVDHVSVDRYGRQLQWNWTGYRGR